MQRPEETMSIICRAKRTLMIWLTWPFACASLLPKFRAEKSITVGPSWIVELLWLAIFT